MKISGPKRDEETWDWRRLHNEGLHDLYTSNIMWVIKPNEVRGGIWHVSGRGEVHTGF
jgi:hypothetical protein